MGDWIGPDDPWPAHSKPFWRKALDAARAAGWSVRPFDGHSWGRVACRPDPVDDRCELLIFSTGNGSETIASELQKMVRACRHRTAHEVTLAGWERALLAASRHFDDAEGLILAAERCAEADKVNERTQELLALAMEKLELGHEELADELFDDAGALEVHELRIREGAASAMPGDAEVRVEREALTDAATEAVGAGRRAMRNVRADRKSALVTRSEEIRTRIQHLEGS